MAPSIEPLHTTTPAAKSTILEQIGNSPLVRLNKIPQSLGIEAQVWVKCEFFNAGSSVKDRIALRMIEKAEQSGRIKPGDTLIELQAATQALASHSIRQPESHIGVARRLQKEIPNAHILDQYGNPDNPLAHEHGTAEEMWTQTEGKITAVVAGAGTGGTITGIARGLQKHNKDIKIIAADPKGSILALPSTLNDDGANEAYKVEGIGYDFIPDVLDQQLVNTWYKTNDRDSFHYARRLIAEEGLLVGGSSGSAIAALVAAHRDGHFTKDDVVVVVLPDSIRSYLSKFADDDWLAANDLLPPTPPAEPASPLKRTTSHKEANDPFSGATVRALRLKPIQTIPGDSTCASAIEVMRDKGFDQLPVTSKKGKRLIGLVTLGNLLSRISHGRAKANSPVSEVMFDFSNISEVVTDPRDFGSGLKGKSAGQNGETNGTNGHHESIKGGRKKEFAEITMDTPLSALNRFLEYQSAAIVTERDQSAIGGSNKGALKPIGIVTKVDLLTWMVSQHKI
ncbi:Cystathionine beta-synthase [Cyphellophora attinorum]|uniref:Cystathionine beta-synthase n=1 Tax=Cyphellophora attinorum TaxID=1664694 RepID=A0A0N1HKQ0_9EURO|nr:Cystathionine beta-synthase [Phialophora attinorum]KPI34903.1 Cystathionine beta-synthase [Phialophora attinorum]